MKINPFALLAVVSLSVMADEHDDSYYGGQDVYISAGYTYHELEGDKGSQYSLLFGGRNYSEKSWFVGGEFEYGFINNSVKGQYQQSTLITVDESHSINGYLLGGKRFEMGDSMSVSAYAIGGYSHLALKAQLPGDTDHIKAYGMKWGAGADLMITDYMLSVRWTQANLEASELSNEVTETNISGMVGYRF